VALATWTIYLAWRLPRVYVAEHWVIAWVGLDVAQVTALLLTAWAAHRRRIVFVVFADVAATLFLVDAWFDCTTARSGDLRQSLFLALVVEIPAALVLYRVAWVAVRRSVTMWGVDDNAPSPNVWTLEIPYPESDDEEAR